MGSLIEVVDAGLGIVRLNKARGIGHVRVANSAWCRARVVAELGEGVGCATQRIKLAVYFGGVCNCHVLGGKARLAAVELDVVFA